MGPYKKSPESKKSGLKNLKVDQKTWTEMSFQATGGTKRKIFYTMCMIDFTQFTIYYPEVKLTEIYPNVMNRCERSSRAPAYLSHVLFWGIIFKTSSQHVWQTSRCSLYFLCFLARRSILLLWKSSFLLGNMLFFRSNITSYEAKKRKKIGQP